MNQSRCPGKTARESVRRAGGLRGGVGVCLTAALLASAPEAWAWGPAVHRLTTSEAVDTLPKDLKRFYRQHRYQIPALSLEAEFPEEGPDRRFAADRLLGFPFSDLPRSEEALRIRFGDQADGVGRLPWMIHACYLRLVEAFRASDRPRILEESDLLAALVTDLHNPLALTENSDGQKTGQHGLWNRFAVRLPEAMEKRLDLAPDAAHYLDRPAEHVFSILNGTYVWLDNLLYLEELAHRGKGGYTEIYYDAFEARVSALLRERLSRAAAEAGSYWYTAWTQAGRPQLD